MIFIAESSVLGVGVCDKIELLRELPIRVVSLRSGAEAISSLKSERYDSVVCRWDLADMPGGRFLKSLRIAKPGLPLIAVIQADNQEIEIAARSLGVSAVLSEDDRDDYFIDTVLQVLRLYAGDTAKEIFAVNNSRGL